MLAGRTAVLPQRGAVSMPALPSSRAALPAALTAQTLRTDGAANSLRRADLVIQVRWSHLHPQEQCAAYGSSQYVKRHALWTSPALEIMPGNALLSLHVRIFVSVNCAVSAAKV